MSSGLTKIFLAEIKQAEKGKKMYKNIWSETFIAAKISDSNYIFQKLLLLHNSFQSWFSTILEMMPFLRLLWKVTDTLGSPKGPAGSRTHPNRIVNLPKSWKTSACKMGHGMHCLVFLQGIEF